MGCILSHQSLTEKTPYRFAYSPSYRVIFLIEASSSRYIASVKLTHSYPTQPSTETSHSFLCDVHNNHTEILCYWAVGAAPSESVWPTWASGRRLRLLGLTLHTLLPFILRPEESFAISEPDPFGEGFAKSQGPRPWFLTWTHSFRSSLTSYTGVGKLVSNTLLFALSHFLVIWLRHKNLQVFNVHTLKGLEIDVFLWNHQHKDVKTHLSVVSY